MVSLLRMQQRVTALAILLGILAGCRSRLEVSSHLDASNQQSVSYSQADQPTEFDDLPSEEQEPSADAPQTTEDEVSATTAPLPPTADAHSVDAHQWLEEAGAQLEFDGQGRLTGLDLSDALVTGPIMELLADLQDLQWIDLRQTPVQNEDLAVLSDLSQLEFISLSDTAVTDDGLSHLRSLKNLRFISLDRTAVTDVGLRALIELPELKGISALETQITLEAQQLLKSLRPECQIILERAAENPDAEPNDSQLPMPFPQNTQPAPKAPTTNDSASVTSKNAVSVTSTTPAQTKAHLSSLLRDRLLDREVLDALGQHLLSEGHYEKAIRVFHAELQLQPENDRARYQMAIALARSGNHRDAHGHFASIMGDAAAHYNLGVIASEHGRWSLCQRHFEQALELDPAMSDARAWLARLQRSHQQPKQTAASQNYEDDRAILNLLMTAFGGGAESHAQEPTQIEIVPGSQFTQSPKSHQSQQVQPSTDGEVWAHGTR